jgi:hypothetical protein
MRRLVLLSLLFLATRSLSADERPFAFSYEADVLPKGALEFEQSISNRLGHAQGIYSAFDLRQELESGLTDNLTASVYLNSKSEYQSVTDPSTGLDVTTEDFHFEGVSTEWKYRFLSPQTHWLGLLGYGELSYNGPELELEGKIILQHDLSESLTTVVNLVAEDEYAYTASEQDLTGKLELTAGLSWQVQPELSLALEARNHREWADDWGREAFSTWSLGPTVHVARGKWWATLGVLPQISGWPESLPGDGRNLTDAEKVETRLLLGVEF